MKQIFTVIILLFAISTKAQIGIGTSTPDASAKLEVNSTSKGLLIPQISLTGSSDAKASVIGKPKPSYRLAKANPVALCKRQSFCSSEM